MKKCSICSLDWAEKRLFRKKIDFASEKVCDADGFYESNTCNDYNKVVKVVNTDCMMSKKDFKKSLFFVYFGTFFVDVSRCARQ